MSKRPAGLAGLALLAVVAVLWYLVAPPRSADGYRDEATRTLETVSSYVQTARLWIRELDRGHVMQSSALVAFEEADRGAANAVAAFEALQPPDGMGDVRTRVSKSGGDAADAVARVRVAARSGRWSDVRRLAESLSAASRRLSRAAAS